MRNMIRRFSRPSRAIHRTPERRYRPLIQRPRWLPGPFSPASAQRPVSLLRPIRFTASRLRPARRHLVRRRLRPLHRLSR